VVALQDIVKIVKYHKRCFDQIEPSFNENKELTTEVDRLREKLEAAKKEKAELETSRRNTYLQVSYLAVTPRALKSVVNIYSCTD
jgi:regulator of replication initiation timing